MPYAHSSAPAEPSDPGLPAAAAGAWLDAQSKARALIDGDMRIRWTNPTGAALIASRHELEARGGALAAIDRGHQELLTAFVRLIDADLSALPLARADGGGFLLVRGRRIEGGLLGLTLVRTGADYPSRFLGLDGAFGLTPAEHKMLLSLLAGNEAEALTRLHGVSIDTVRTHIRNLYAKMGVNSRERLFALAQPFRV